MNTLRMGIARHPLNYFRFVCNKKAHQNFPLAVCYYATTIDIDSIAYDLLDRYRTNKKNNIFDVTTVSIRSFMDKTDITKNITNLNEQEVEDLVLECMTKNKDGHLEQILQDSCKHKKYLSKEVLRKLFTHYSALGKTDIIPHLQKYCLKIYPNLYRQSGEFLHYLARAQCLKGNSHKGLALLKDCYEKNESMRSGYRLLFRELIQDSVLNRSEASIVTFRKYVIEFSEVWDDHYPLICLWHICWSSNWFSDQVLASELLDTSNTLREIVTNKAVALSTTVLRDYYNEDAVVRLLQAFLKYKLMDEYAKVLQVLFTYKLRNRDIRGCTEIMKNCEVLGVSLPSVQQGKYIKMLIYGNAPPQPKQQNKPAFKNFKLKF